MLMKTNYMKAIAITASALLLGSSLYASELDDRIEDAAKKSYTFKTYLKNESVSAESKNGVVILKGTVSDSSYKALAEDTVENLPGVVSVDNRIKVKGEKSVERSDAWLTTKVKSTLVFHRNVSASKTEVDVKDGVVTLRGEASSMAQKELTGEYARDVEGVKDVVNELTVLDKSPTVTETIADKIDDASITAQVKASLLSHRSTSALKTKVQTKDGVVTVTGIAKNEAEKSLVTKLVSDVNGVVSVVNNMTVSAVASR